MFESLFWILTGLAICVAAWRAGPGSFIEPGAGFVALLCGIFLMAMGLIVGLTRRFGSASEPDRGEDGGKTVGFLAQSSAVLPTLGFLVFYAVFLNTLGYIVTTFVLMFGLFCSSSASRWPNAAFASLLSVAVTYLVFETWLRCQLPRGILPWW